MLAILDGPVIDDGTACEIGIFYGLMQSDPAKKGIVGMTHDLRATRDSNREGEVKGLNLFVVGCIEAAGTIVTSLDDAQRVLEGWRLARGALLLELPQLHAPDLPAPRLRQLESTNSISRGYLYGAVTRLTWSCSSRDELVAAARGRAAARRTPSRSARGRGRACRRPRSPRPPACSSSALSTSNGPIRYAAERITSSARPVNQR